MGDHLPGTKASLKPFFEPKTVAVVGASRETRKPGHVILRNFLERGFAGKVYPVNPKTEEIAGLKCHSSVKDVPDEIDLAVIATPAKAVTQVIQECADKKVKAAVIISSGFGETGPEGKKREDEIREIASKAGTRLVGPNCIGIFDAYSGVDTLFLPRYRLARPTKGSISFISQSGAFGVAMLDWAASLGVGISKFVSYGNMVDVNEIDLLEYLKDDPTTRMVIMYIEQTADGRKLMEIARQITMKKPVVAIKAGRTAEGAKAAASHTGALAGSDSVYWGAFKQTGIVRAFDPEELMDFAVALNSQPPAVGNRIAIVTNGGGFGVMATDEIIRRKLSLAELSGTTKRYLREKLPPYVSVEDPVDLMGDTDAQRYLIALDLVLKDPNVDGAVVIVLFQTPLLESGVVDTIAEMATKYRKPITVCATGGDYVEIHRKMLERSYVPCYQTPERAARAMWALAFYGDYLKRATEGEKAA